MSEARCRNCGAGLTGDYCPACGQRRFRPQDRRIGHLLGEAFGALTDFDSRIWRSLRAVLLQPGRIARDYIDGRRAHWVSPLRLFLLANLLYFLIPSITDLSLPLHSQASGAIYREFSPGVCDAPATAWKCAGGQLHGGFTEPLLRARLLEEQRVAVAAGGAFSFDAFEQRYNARSDEIGKFLVVLHVPFMAIALMLLAWRSRRYFAEHFVVALGLLTFLMLIVPLAIRPLASAFSALLLGAGVDPGPALRTMAVIALVAILAHFTLACRRCYESALVLATIQACGVLAAFAVSSLLVYRAVQFLLSLWLV